MGNSSVNKIDPLLPGSSQFGGRSRHRRRKSLFEATYVDIEVAQGHIVRATAPHPHPRVGGSDRKGFLKESIIDRVILTAREEVILLDSSEQSTSRARGLGSGR